MFAPQTAKTAKTQSKANLRVPLAHERSCLAYSGFRRDLAQQAAGEIALGERQYGSWNFSRVPVFPPGREAQPQSHASFHSAPLPGVIQTKLVVNEPGDVYEREADHDAEQVMRMAAPGAPAQTPAKVGDDHQCSCGGTCSKCQHGGVGHDHPLLRHATGPGIASRGTGAPASVHNVLNSPGQALDASTRAFMEPRFGRDFSHVRVHADPHAAESARAVGARAYAVGRHVVFGEGEVPSATNAGRKLLAHELAHVIQQHRNTAESTPDSLLLRAPLKGPGLARLSAVQLEVRAREIFENAARKYIRDTGANVTLAQLEDWYVVGVAQGVKNGKVVTLVGVNDKAFLPYIEEFVEPGERIVEPIELTAYHARRRVPTLIKSGAAHAHAEPPVHQQAVVEGVDDVIVGSSVPGCADCVAQMPRDTHVNPKVTSRASIERAGKVRRPATTTDVEINPRKKFRLGPNRNLPSRKLSRPVIVSGEIDAADVPAKTTSGGVPDGPSVIVDDTLIHPDTPTLKASAAPAEGSVPTLAPKPTPPQGGFFSRRLSAVKTGLTEGIEAAFSPEGIASEIPMVLLAIADRVAARDAVRNIRIKFEKEGFAKGVAAGVMQWTPEEVALNLKNHVTPFRLEHLEDPAGILSNTFIFQYAEAYENYAVDVGYHFASRQTPEWKKDARAKGLAALGKLHYNTQGTDEQLLFEYDYIKNLAYELRPITDPIVDQSIEKGKERQKEESQKSRNEAGCVGMKC